jgi:hypothetical protein
MRISRSIKPILAVAVGIGASAVCSGVAKASVVELGSWMPVPNTTNTAYPELVYTSGVGLSTGLGALSSGDGNVAPSLQQPGGLEADTVVYAPEPYSFNSSAFTGGTGYYDTSLTFSGLAPSGAATTNGIEDQQLLGGGTFTLSLTSVAPASSLPLLIGTVSPGSTLITGFDGSTSGAVFTADAVTYTGGAWVNALPSYAILSGNSFSIAMTAVNPPFGVSGTNPNYTLNSFDSNADGYFDINLSGSNTQVPEPATLSLLFIGAGALGLRRRQRKA